MYSSLCSRKNFTHNFFSKGANTNMLTVCFCPHENVHVLNLRVNMHAKQALYEIIVAKIADVQILDNFNHDGKT